MSNLSARSFILNNLTIVGWHAQSQTCFACWIECERVNIERNQTENKLEKLLHSKLDIGRYLNFDWTLFRWHCKRLLSICWVTLLMPSSQSLRLNEFSGNLRKRAVQKVTWILRFYFYFYFVLYILSYSTRNVMGLWLLKTNITHSLLALARFNLH